MIVVASVWGLNHVIVKHTLSNMGPLAFNSVRFSLASLVLLLILRLVEKDIRLDPQDMRPLARIGFLGYTLNQYFYIIGLNQTTAGKAAVLMAASPVFVALMEKICGRARYSWLAWLGIWGSFAGVLMVTTGSKTGLSLTSGSLAGDVLVLGGSMSWAYYTIHTRPLMTRLSPLRVTAYTTLFGTIPLVAVSVPALLNQDWSSVTLGSWGALVFSCMGPVVLGCICWNWGIQRLGSGRTAIYNNLNQVVASLAGWVLLGERWSPLQAAGALFILMGVTFVRTGAEKRGS